jgi:hypothetical protein
MFKNISGTVAISVLEAGDNVSKIKTIRLTNTHASTAATVDLFIDSNSDGKAEDLLILTAIESNTISAADIIV